MDDCGRRIVLDLPFERATSATLQAFKEEGFQPTMCLDVTDMNPRLLDREFRRYLLMTVIDPAVLDQALRCSLSAGVMLPINVALYELGSGETVVAVSEPLGAAPEHYDWRRAQPVLANIADQLGERVAGALDRLLRKAAAARCRACPAAA